MKSIIFPPLWRNYVGPYFWAVFLAAILHALASMTNFGEAVKLVSSLPILLIGIYGWVKSYGVYRKMTASAKCLNERNLTIFTKPVVQAGTYQNIVAWILTLGFYGTGIIVGISSIWLYFSPQTSANWLIISELIWMTAYILLYVYYKRKLVSIRKRINLDQL